ncbi:MAG: hypothetical protein WBG70_19765 [Spirulinaceae cyanobacterium]
MIANFQDVFGEGNPQLIRELKGKLKPINIAIATAASLFGQFLLYLFFHKLLPNPLVGSLEKFSRYCQGNTPDFLNYPSSQHCTTDSLGNLAINWQLWGLDIFICTSVIGIVALLVGGTYLLIRDLSQEESRGTLGFIRLSPQPAAGILTGKILGVPSLLYLFCALGLPLNFYGAMEANIPPLLVASFYGILAVSCIFFYTAALLFSLVNNKLAAFSPWLGSGTVLAFLIIVNIPFLSNIVGLPVSAISHTPFDWFIVFYPGILLPHLIAATSLAPIYNFDAANLAQLRWYGMPFWSHAGATTAFVLANYYLWTSWLWQGLKRRFHNPNNALITRRQSYWLSGSFIATIIGFVPQQPEFGTYQAALFENFGFVMGLTLILFLALIPTLSPQRQTLQDWASYRYQSKYDRWSLWKDLVWGEKSPATLAIALNLFTATAVILPGILMLPLQEYKLPVFFGMLFTASLILLYACIFQLALLMKRPQHGIWLAMAVFVSTIFPFMTWWLLKLNPHTVPGLGFFTFLPTTALEYTQVTTLCFSLFVPWLSIALISWQTKRQLQKVGESETKALLT